MDPVARDLIEKLLCRNPKERLGAGPEGILAKLPSKRYKSDFFRLRQ